MREHIAQLAERVAAECYGNKVTDVVIDVLDRERQSRAQLLVQCRGYLYRSVDESKGLLLIITN